MRRTLLLIIFLCLGSTIFTSCENADSDTDTSDKEYLLSFKIEKEENTITFINLSSGYDEYKWEFGDGEDSVVSDTTRIVYTYYSAGSYTATLIGIKESKEEDDTEQYFIIDNEATGLEVKKEIDEIVENTVIKGAGENEKATSIEYITTEDFSYPIFDVTIGTPPKLPNDLGTGEISAKIMIGYNENFEKNDAVNDVEYFSEDPIKSSEKRYNYGYLTSKYGIPGTTAYYRLEVSVSDGETNYGPYYTKTKSFILPEPREPYFFYEEKTTGTFDFAAKYKIGEQEKEGTPSGISLYFDKEKTNKIDLNDFKISADAFGGPYYKILDSTYVEGVADVSYLSSYNKKLPFKDTALYNESTALFIDGSDVMEHTGEVVYTSSGYPSIIIKDSDGTEEISIIFTQDTLMSSLESGKTYNLMGHTERINSTEEGFSLKYKREGVDYYLFQDEVSSYKAGTVKIFHISDTYIYGYLNTSYDGELKEKEDGGQKTNGYDKVFFFAEIK